MDLRSIGLGGRSVHCSNLLGVHEVLNPGDLELPILFDECEDAKNLMVDLRVTDEACSCGLRRGQG